MLKHITQIIWNERRHNIGVWIELFLVSLFLWYIVDYVSFYVGEYIEPLGFDTEHTYIMKLGELSSNSADFVEEDPTVNKGDHLVTIMDRVKRSSMIEAASFSFFSSPHIGSNSWADLYKDSLNMNLLRRVVTPDFFRVFRYESTNGSTNELMKALEKGELVVSAEVEKELFPDGTAVGNKVTLGNNHPDNPLLTIGAVSTKIKYDNFSGGMSDYFAALLDVNMLSYLAMGNINYLELCVRVKPEEDYDFFDRFRNQMGQQFRVGNFYLNTIQYIPANKEEFHKRWVNDLKTRGFIGLFLLINILLGITGTFWFRTQYRRNEIGVRIAMGETREGLLKMFYTEGLLLLTFAMVPAMLVFAFIRNSEILEDSSAFTIGRYFMGFGITYLLLALMILLGIWFPARKAVKVSPADALRDE
ncbi:MAG TPA: ABC transporter permease [Dysgonamonadaceae bacterium]|nr:ABC transporter permease [Dysgonamonadaceae bacterium]